MFWLGVLFFCTCLFIGCGGETEIAYDWESPPPAELLKDYHKKSTAGAPRTPIVEEHKPKDDTLCVYQDFSDGFQYAWKDFSSMEFYKLFVRSLKLSKTKFFAVGEKSNEELGLGRTLDEKALFAHVADARNYNQNYAALDKALESIVNTGKSAVFVTDGELFTRVLGEVDYPWARKGFAQWLKGGNRLSFYVTSFKEKGKAKYVYYMIFTPANAIGTSSDVARTLKSVLEDVDASGQGIAFNSFHFQNNAFDLKKNFSETNSGSFNNELDIIDYELNPQDRWEYAMEDLDWSGIYKLFAQNPKDKDEGGPVIGRDGFNDDYQGTKFVLDARGLDFYEIKSVKVSDIYDDFYAYAIAKTCSAQKGESESACNDSLGMLKAKYEYSPRNSPILENVLALNKNLFDSTMQQKKGEIEIQLAANFNTHPLSAEHKNFLKLELEVDEIQPKTNDPRLKQHFVWEGKSVQHNRTMYESIVLALRDALPEREVIWTWYFVTPASDNEY